MTSNGGATPRVALAATPRLLADALRRLLAGVADTTIVLEAEEWDEQRFDVAIVTTTAPSIPADLTIVLDESPESRGGGSIHGDSEGFLGRLDDLESLVDLVSSIGQGRQLDKA